MPIKKMTPRVRVFIDTYLATWNATTAAKMALYKNPGVIGARYLQEPIVKAAIEERLAQLAMTSNEVLLRLSQQGRATVEDFVSFTDAQGNPVAPYIDLDRARAEGKLHLLRRIKFGPQIEIELHDAQSALTQLGRVHGLFTDKTELTGAGGDALQVHIYIPDNGRGTDSGDDQGN